MVVEATVVVGVIDVVGVVLEELEEKDEASKVGEDSMLREEMLAVIGSSVDDEFDSLLVEV